MVLAPEHPLVDRADPDAVARGHPRRRGPAARATRARRSAATAPPPAAAPTWTGRPASAQKTGVFTGSYATNPVTGQQVPVFVADYVLMGYGTGAIMAVPGQDERDWEFAEVFELPIVRTVPRPRAWRRRRRTPATGRPSTRPTTRSRWTAWTSPRPRRASSTGWRSGRRPGRGHLPPARLAVRAASATGASRSRSCTTTRACRCRCPSRCCRSSCPTPTDSRRAPSTPTTPTPRPSRRWAG